MTLPDGREESLMKRITLVSMLPLFRSYDVLQVGWCVLYCVLYCVIYCILYCILYCVYKQLLPGQPAA